MNPEEYHFVVFKGLQKPLEFMGIRGRFLTLAAAGIGMSFLGYIILMLIFGQLVGGIFLLVSVAGSLLTIYIKQKQGLHNKKKCRDILIYHNVFIR